MLKEHDYAPNVPPLSTIPSSTTHTDGAHSDTDSTDTATNSDDEFNWDEDEDPSTSKSYEKTKAKRGRAIYLAFMKLARPVRVFLLGALGAGILITPLIVVQLRFKSNPVRPQVHVWSLWLSIIWAAGCVTYLVVDAIPSLVIAFVVLFGGQVERLKIQLELTLAVSGWLKLALDISWAWISLSVLRSVYEPSGHYWVIVNRVMQALFSFGILLLAEKLCLQFIAINFHQKALADRLSENRLGLRALDRLSNAQPVIPGRKKAHAKRGHKSLGGSVDLNHAINNENGSPAREKHHRNSRSAERKRRRKAMASIIVDQVSGAIGQVALKNSKFNRENEFGSLSSARRLARKLFSALGDKRDFLIVEDFEPYFRTTAEAHEAFHLFDKDGNGDISKREMREAVQRIYRERKDLVTSLKDAGSAVAKLDAVMIGLVLIVLIFVCLLIFNPSDTIESLVPMATIVVGFSFIFGNSAATLFQSLLFIFSTHVFDVGDLVMIDDQYLFVKEFGLFSTVFRRVDGQEIIAPNSLLASSKLVHNIRRSGSMYVAETTELEVAYDTPLEVIEELRTRIIQYANDNNREWASAALNIDKMEYMNAIYLTVAVEHRPNWQDWGGRWTRRNAFMKFLKGVLEELDVKYMMPTQPVLLPSYAQATNNPNPFNNSSTAVNRQPSSPSRIRTPQPRNRTESVRSARSARSMQEQQEMMGNAGTFSGNRGFLRAPGQGTLRSELDSTF
ncbi:Mechanosensitive ion channel-domain-containing protein [Lentinula novae-zelandiae]|nr:Mechanosensitive ion channel-domain-containing protein [Lentinula novae-zelandiae]